MLTTSRMSPIQRDILVRTVIWLGLIALWISLNKPEGASVFAFRAGAPRIFGAALVVAGLSGYAWSARWLATGAPIAQMTPLTLLRRGPYGYVRNPLYLSVGLLLIGIATLYRPWSVATVAWTAAIALSVHFAVIRFEEPNTRKQLGADYDHYCRLVPRWFPRRPRP
jgi:protein-S-isoprenylcysteine O-methyltransferase Ste14